jgi:tRNA threonylcarbamoyladenosine biosynthesis protein TsaE
MTDSAIHIQTNSPDETEALGELIAPFIPVGTIIALYGDLAAGKTCLVHGFAKAFKVKDPVSSPTFTIVNEYHGTQTLYHLDLYRLTTPRDLYDIGCEEYFDNPGGICLIEWAERAEEILPVSRLNIRMEHQGEDLRAITINSDAPLAAGWLEAVKKRFAQET